MIAVIFEVTPTDAGMEDYLELAGDLKKHLSGLDGFIAIERYRSLADPGRLLSLSFWRDEAAVVAWRNHPDHKLAQSRGRRDLFRDYRLRVASVLRDYGMYDREQVPG